MSKNEPHIANKGLAKIRKGLERERFFLEAAIDAMLLSDIQGNILLANKAFSKLTGHKRRNLAGTPFSRYFIQGTQVEELFKERPGPQSDREGIFTILDHQSRNTEVKVRISPAINDDGEVTGVFITLRDLSGQK